MTPRDFREFLLAELKCAALRARLVTAEIDSIGCALRGNFITPDDAIAWLDESGALQFLSSSPPLAADDREQAP
jgi:hypothetical protein